jgi:hypothetical protein
MKYKKDVKLENAKGEKQITVLQILKLPLTNTQ